MSKRLLDEREQRGTYPLRQLFNCFGQVYENDELCPSVDNGSIAMQIEGDVNCCGLIIWTRDNKTFVSGLIIAFVLGGES